MKQDTHISPDEKCTWVTSLWRSVRCCEPREKHVGDSEGSGSSLYCESCHIVWWLGTNLFAKLCQFPYLSINFAAVYVHY